LSRGLQLRQQRRAEHLFLSYLPQQPRLSGTQEICQLLLVFLDSLQGDIVHVSILDRPDHCDLDLNGNWAVLCPGEQDGLFWRNADGTPGGPISEPVARAIAEGYSVDRKSAYHGYYFKILKGQGPAAPLGRIDYVIEGIMIGGFALVAVPAEYGVTGVKTFIVSNDGIVYQKDLGPNSLALAKQMELYNPDKTWHRTDDEWPADSDEVATESK
jgi:hypothetical protein